MRVYLINTESDLHNGGVSRKNYETQTVWVMRNELDSNSKIVWTDQCFLRHNTVQTGNPRKWGCRLYQTVCKWLPDYSFTPQTTIIFKSSLWEAQILHILSRHILKHLKQHTQWLNTCSKKWILDYDNAQWNFKIHWLPQRVTVTIKQRIYQ